MPLLKTRGSQKQTITPQKGQSLHENKKDKAFEQIPKYSLESSKHKERRAWKHTLKLQGQGQSSELNGLSGLLESVWSPALELLRSFLDPISLTTSNVNLKSRTAHYFTSQMCLFGNNKGIAIQDVQAMANQRQVWKSKKRWERKRVGRGCMPPKTMWCYLSVDSD